jgi:peptidyl-prolyl cis-trans isomerase D
MLDALRVASQKWFGRLALAIVLGVIIVSFGIWGVGDVFRNFGANQLARVGHSDISVEAYREAYQRALQNIQQQMQQAITDEQARQFGIDRQVLVRLISDAVLDQAGKSYGLAMSDKELAQNVMDDDKFKGGDGKFDRQSFDAQLRNAGVTERRFVSDLRSEYLRREQIAPLLQGLAIPNVMLEAMNRYTNEVRSVDYLTLPPSAAGTIEPPGAEALKAFYDVRRDLYRTPEYRKIAVLALTPEALAASTLVADAELEKRYEDVKAERYTKPETRKIEQILLPDEAAAKAASDKIAAGETFEQLAADQKLTDKDIDLGTVSKVGLGDKTVAEAAFALPIGEVSKPVKAQFGWALLRVTNIVPSQVVPFENVKADLEKELVQINARREMSKIRDEIEDRRTAGKSLAEAAAGTGLTLHAIDAVDAQGRDKSSAAIADLPDRQALLKAVFASDVGVDNEPIESHDGSTIWFEVASVEPARQETLDEVKALVEHAWQDDERSKRLTAKASDLVKKLQGGDTLKSIAEAEGNLEIKHAGTVKRSGAEGLSQNAVVQIFNVGVGGTGSGIADGGSRLIFQVLDADVPPIDPQSPDFNKLTEQVKSALGDDLLAQYLGDLQHQIGVSINQHAVQTALGSSPEGQ